MHPFVAAGLLGVLAVAGCADPPSPREEARAELEADIAASIADRADIPAEDKAAIAATLAEDVVSIGEEAAAFAEVEAARQAEIAASLPSVDDLKQRECEGLALELEAAQLDDSIVELQARLGGC
jgi:hypothetical protein